MVINNCCSFDGNYLVEMCWKKLWNVGLAVLFLGIAAEVAALLHWIFLVMSSHGDASGDIWKGPLGIWPYSMPGHSNPEAQIKNPTLEMLFPSQRVHF